MVERYESPLISRYASEEMLRLFSQRTRIETWRRLWLELARAERELGLPITQGQVEELEAQLGEIDFDFAAERERALRHDVMAHIAAYGKAAPGAAGIIHLGATSCYVTDNGDLILYREALGMLRARLRALLKVLAGFAERTRALATLGYTHYQPAQPVTVGKRATLWMQDLICDLEELDAVSAGMKFLGCRGTTGTEASFLQLFDGDGEKVDRLNAMLAERFGFAECWAVCGQTYPRKADCRILNALSGIAQSCTRLATDIRLLQHDRQLEEPFAESQVGSSAMPYKRNPMRCERICSLSRSLITLSLNAPLTAAGQWLERTLDDSANRRLTMPEAFLCADAVLRLAQNVCEGLTVNEKVIAKALEEVLPFLATENLMMEAVKRGGDRQQLHEVIRRCSMTATRRMKDGEDGGLPALLAAEPAFGMTEEELRAQLDPGRFIGRAPEQVDAFLRRYESLWSGTEAVPADIPF